MQVEPTNSSLSDAQDVLYHIVQYLDPDRSSVEDSDLAHVRQTLFSVALTCRNFTRPALTALWRFLPSDKPLTDLLVTLGLAEYSAFLDGSHPSPLALKLRGSVDPRTYPQWSRFRDYARHVREICVESSLVSLKLSIWYEVSQLMPDEPILPLLHSVDITIGSMDRPNLAAQDTLDLGIASILLISPSVRQIKFCFKKLLDPRNKESEDIVSNACARARNLETLILEANPWIWNSSILRSSPRLRSLTIHGMMGVNDIEPLTHLEELEHLSIIPSGGGSPVSTLHFPSLRRLCLGAIWEFIYDLIGWVLAPKIRSLELDVPQISSQELIRESRRCLQSIAGRFSTLERLTVHYTTFLPFSPLYQAVLGPFKAIVEPLWSLRGIRDITLHFSACLQLTSDDLRMLSEAWPDIEELRIYVEAVVGGRAGFESILNFARRCSRLRVLRLPAMELSPGAFEGLEYPASSHPLRDLDVARVVFPLDADLSQEMAMFVQRVFPNAAERFVKQHCQIAMTGEE